MVSEVSMVFRGPGPLNNPLLIQNMEPRGRSACSPGSDLVFHLGASTVPAQRVWHPQPSPVCRAPHAELAVPSPADTEALCKWPLSPPHVATGVRSLGWTPPGHQDWQGQEQGHPQLCSPACLTDWSNKNNALGHCCQPTQAQTSSRASNSWPATMQVSARKAQVSNGRARNRKIPLPPGLN